MATGSGAMSATMALSGMVTAPSLARGTRIGLFCSKIRGRLRAMRNFWLATLTTFVGCSSAEPLPPPDAQLLVGQEMETWSADPAPTHVQIEMVESTRRTVVGDSAAPATTITLKSPSFPSGTIASFEATGTDASGSTVVHGTSVPYVLYD